MAMETAPLDSAMDKAMDKDPFLRTYVDTIHKQGCRRPKFYDIIDVKQLAEIRKEAQADPNAANIVYRVGKGYVHIWPQKNLYTSVERALDQAQKDKIRSIKELILEKASDEESSETKEDLERILEKLYDASVEQKDGGGKKLFIGGTGKMGVDEDEYELLKTHIKRDIVGFGPIEPLILDQYIEDIHLVGTSKIRVSHKAFQYGLETNIRFEDDVSLNDYFIGMSERMGRPVSASRPIVDGTLPDGSRINMIYSNEISARGSSFTIRKFSAEPISPLQLIKWGTMSTELAAYIWLCMENKMNIMISGETASGKTTTMNAVLSFMDHRGKVYSVEDTPEVKPPQKSWQRCVTREAGPEESRVTMFDLLRAALRSRPDYIVIGEIRGEEARVAFQCMQTGIPVIASFHASSATKFIQRMTGQPVNIPISFIDNVNIILFQSAVNVNRRFLRRVTHVEEFVGFNREAGGVLTRTVFKWDSSRDRHFFRGMNNSHILENRIALEHGYTDKKEIYKDLKHREKILQKMLDNNITGYQEVNKVLCDYYEKGEDSLPFTV